MVSRLLRLFAVPLFAALVLVAAIPPAMVSADRLTPSSVTASWKNASEIEVTAPDGTVLQFEDKEYDGNWRFEADDSRADNCNSRLGVHNGASGSSSVNIKGSFDNTGDFTKAYLFLKVASGNPQTGYTCELVYGDDKPASQDDYNGVPITLQRAENHLINYYHQGENLVPSDGRQDWVFAKCADNQIPDCDKKWLRASEVNQSCQDEIVLDGIWNPTPASGSTSGVTYQKGRRQEFKGSAGSCSATGTSREVFLGNAAGSVGAPPGTIANGTNVGGGSIAGDESDIACESSGFSLSWIFCPIINGLAETSDKIFETVVLPLLQTGSIDLANPEDAVFKIWSQFRIIANILLILVLLVIVFGQTIGGGIVDAYTAKKTLPKLLAAAILTNLSIYAVAFAVDITNIVGGGIGALLTLPLQQAGEASYTFNGGTAGLGVLGTIGIAGTIGAWFLGSGLAGSIIAFVSLFVLLPVVLAVLGIMFTLIVRRGIIMLLVVIAPVAFVLYALPNTEKYFKKWWELLFKTLLVYPIIVAIMGVADLVAATIGKANDTSGGANFAAGLVIIAAKIGPLFLIPYAFKIAGGTTGAIYGAVAGWSKKGVEAVKGNPNDPTSLRRKTKLGVSNAFNASASDRMKQWRDTSTTAPTNVRGRARRRAAIAGMRTLGIVDWEQKRKDQNELFDKEISGKVAQGADTMERAFFARQHTGPDYTYTDASGNEQILKSGRYYSPYRDSRGVYKESSEADVKNAHRKYDGNESKIQTLIKYETGKVSNDQDFYGVDDQGEVIYDPSQINSQIDRSRMPLGSFLGNLPTVMEESKLSSNSAAGASIGSFFATQAQRRELKHVRPDGQGGWAQDQDAFVQDWAENVGSYAASTSKTSPIKRLTSIYKERDAKYNRTHGGTPLQVGTDDNGQPVYETWTTTDERSFNDLKGIAQGLDTRLRGGYGIASVQEDGTPIPAGSGAAGRVNEAIQEFVQTATPTRREDNS